jgi:hypothetical protein
MKKTTAKQKRAEAKILAANVSQAAADQHLKAAETPAEAPAETVAPAPAPAQPEAKKAKEPKPEKVFVDTRLDMVRTLQTGITEQVVKGTWNLKTMNKESRDKAIAAAKILWKNHGSDIALQYLNAKVDLTDKLIAEEIAQLFMNPEALYKPYEDGFGPVQIVRLLMRELDVVLARVPEKATEAAQA